MPLVAAPRGAAAATMDEPDDRLLLERARAGDTSALERLLAENEARIYRFGLRMCRDPEDAKDVAQETLLAMARNVADFRGASSLSSWLFSIARSYCIKKRRRGRSVVAKHSVDAGETAEAAKVADAAPGPEEVAAGEQVARALEGAIGTLEPKYREVLLLRDVEGLSAAEVAEALAIGVPAVKSRLHRARAQVRERLAPLLGSPAAGAAGAADESRTCPDVVTLLSKKLEGDVDESVCRKLEQHVERCARCRAECDALRRTMELCREAAARPVAP